MIAIGSFSERAIRPAGPERPARIRGGSASRGALAERSAREASTGSGTLQNYLGRLSPEPASTPAEAEADSAARSVLSGGLGDVMSAAGGLFFLREDGGAGGGDDEGGGPWALPTGGPPGQPLDSPFRAEMERGFGRDFGDVRLHTDAASDSLSRQMGARAMTHGQDIFAQSGEVDTATDAGRYVMAHELAHVAQGLPGIHRLPEDEAVPPEAAPTEAAPPKLSQAEMEQKAFRLIAQKLYGMKKPSELYNFIFQYFNRGVDVSGKHFQAAPDIGVVDKMSNAVIDNPALSAVSGLAVAGVGGAAAAENMDGVMGITGSDEGYQSGALGKVTNFVGAGGGSGIAGVLSGIGGISESVSAGGQLSAESKGAEALSAALGEQYTEEGNHIERMNMASGIMGTLGGLGGMASGGVGLADSYTRDRAGKGEADKSGDPTKLSKTGAGITAGGNVLSAVSGIMNTTKSGMSASADDKNAQMAKNRIDIIGKRLWEREKDSDKNQRVQGLWSSIYGDEGKIKVDSAGLNKALMDAAKEGGNPFTIEASRRDFSALTALSGQAVKADSRHGNHRADAILQGIGALGNTIASIGNFMKMGGDNGMLSKVFSMAGMAVGLIGTIGGMIKGLVDNRKRHTQSEEARYGMGGPEARSRAETVASTMKMISEAGAEEASEDTVGDAFAAAKSSGVRFSELFGSLSGSFTGTLEDERKGMAPKKGEAGPVTREASGALDDMSIMQMANGIAGHMEGVKYIAKPLD